MQTLISIIEVILVVVPALLVVAFTTVAERKTMASMKKKIRSKYSRILWVITNICQGIKIVIKWIKSYVK